MESLSDLMRFSAPVVVFYEGGKTNNEAVLSIDPRLKSTINTVVKEPHKKFPNYLVGCCFSYKNNKVTVPNISGSPYKVLIKMMSEFKTHVSVSFDYLNPSKENYLESFFLKNRLRTVF